LAATPALLCSGESNPFTEDATPAAFWRVGAVACEDVPVATPGVAATALAAFPAPPSTAGLSAATGPLPAAFGITDVVVAAAAAGASSVLSGDVELDSTGRCSPLPAAIGAGETGTSGATGAITRGLGDGAGAGGSATLLMRSREGLASGCGRDSVARASGSVLGGDGIPAVGADVGPASTTVREGTVPGSGSGRGVKFELTGGAVAAGSGAGFDVCAIGASSPATGEGVRPETGRPATAGAGILAGGGGGVSTSALGKTGWSSAGGDAERAETSGAAGGSMRALPLVVGAAGAMVLPSRGSIRSGARTEARGGGGLDVTARGASGSRGVSAIFGVGAITTVVADGNGSTDASGATANAGAGGNTSVGSGIDAVGAGSPGEVRSGAGSEGAARSCEAGRSAAESSLPSATAGEGELVSPDAAADGGDAGRLASDGVATRVGSDAIAGPGLAVPRRPKGRASPRGGSSRPGPPAAA
jgi:hypothetical protein